MLVLVSDTIFFLDSFLFNKLEMNTPQFLKSFQILVEHLKGLYFA